MTRLLCVTDTHYDLRQMDWTLERAPGVDIVVLSGDHLQVGGRAPLPAQVVVVSTFLTRLSRSAVVLASSGNHDLDGPGPDGEQRCGWLAAIASGSLYVDGQSLDRHGVRFTVCPWWDGPRTKALVARQLERAAVDRPPQWVWVYHSPPAGTRLCTTGRRAYPDPDLAAWVERWQPDMVICGHIHQAPWAEGGGWVDRIGQTWVFNAGHQPGREPPHIVIDLAARSAAWTGVPESAAVDLAPGGSGLPPTPAERAPTPTS